MSTPIYKIEKNDILGRYMVANRNIKEGELILKEKPLILGPQVDGPPLCFQCCKNISRTGFLFCPKCRIALICSSKCQGIWHTSQECEALTQMNLKGEDLATYVHIIFALRILLLRKYNPEVWNVLMQLESHMEERRGTQIWRRHKIQVEQALIDLKLLDEDDINKEIIQQICGILDVNTFEVRPPQFNGAAGMICPEVECYRGLYLNAALMAHNCVGNTHLSVDNDFVLTVHASVDIPENSTIFFTYCNMLQGTAERKQHLKEGKYFDCNCKRCQDPTELDSDLSSLKCPRCHKGYLRPEKPEQPQPNWKCSNCKLLYKNSIISLTIDEAKRRLEEIDRMNWKQMEELHKRFLMTLHPCHYLVLELEQSLVGLYSTIQPNKKSLLRKIELCEHLLSIFDKLEKGISRFRAITLYELHCAQANLSQKLFTSKEITGEELIEKLDNTESILKLAIKYLLYEPPNSPEGKIAQRALSELKQLRSLKTNFLKESLNSNLKEKPKIIKNQTKVELIEVKDENTGKTIQPNIQNGASTSKTKKNKNRRKKF